MTSKCSKHDTSGFKDNFNLRAGLLLISEAGVLSFILASSLLVHSLRQVYKNYRGRNSTSGPSTEPWLQPISILFLCAIFLDVIYAVSNILSIRWALSGEVIEGSYCTTQAVLKQIGGNGVAWFTMAIAILTYLQVVHWSWFGESGAKVFAAGSICFIIIFIFMIILVPASTVHPYYGKSGLWCWIGVGKGTSRQRLRYATQYAWEWLAVLVSIVSYGAVAYKWLRQASSGADYDLKRVAIAMGWYPIAYCVVIAPISVVRFRQFNGYHPTAAEQIFPAALLASWGAINAILWFLTGRRFGFSSKKKDDYPSVPFPGSQLDETEMTAQATSIRTGNVVYHDRFETVPIFP